jgi:RNA polymerase sigma factor (sigma-70 family)
LGSPLDSLLGAYSRLPIPTKEEQVLLGRAIRTWLDWAPSPDEAPPGVKRAGRRAREQMVSRNMLLVARQARSFSVSSVVALEVQDLIQEGAIGLTRAAEKFDPTLGYSFATYAVPWIRQSMTRLVHTSGAIRIPVKRASSMNQLRQWVEAFTAREGRSPTDQEALDGMGISAADLRILRQAAAVRRVGSLDAVMGDGDGDSFLSTVAAPASWSSLERDLMLEAMKPWPDLQEVLDRLLAGQCPAEISLAMGITRTAAVKLADRAQAMAQRLMAADQPKTEMSLKLVVEIEMKQIALLPLPAEAPHKQAKKCPKPAPAVVHEAVVEIEMEQQLSLLPLVG